MGENAIADLIDYLSANGPPDNMKESECQLILRALRLLAAAEGGEGTPDQSVMEVVSTVEDIVTAARLTQFYDDPIYKPWSEQVWRSVDTARRTIATRRKVLERIATERNGLAARVRELEEERCCTCRDGALKQPYSTMPPLQTLPWGTEK